MKISGNYRFSWSSFLLAGLMFGLIFGLMSCEEEIPFNPEAQEKRLVINSIQEEGDLFSVHLSESVPILFTNFGENVIVEDAQLNLYGNGEFLETLAFTENDLYQTDSTRVAQGITYRLEASHPNYPEASASFRLPAPPNIILAELDDPIDQVHYPIDLTIADEPDVDNYYLLEIYTDGWVADPRLLSFTSNDPYLLYGSDPDPAGETSFFGRAMWSDAGRDGTSIPLQLEVELPFGGGLWIYVEVKCIPRNYYLYLLTVRDQQNTGFDPFAQPGIIDNQVEGGIGLFTGYSKSRESWFIQ
jgi:hypothetical protein